MTSCALSLRIEERHWPHVSERSLPAMFDGDLDLQFLAGIRYVGLEVSQCEVPLQQRRPASAGRVPNLPVTAGCIEWHARSPCRGGQTGREAELRVQRFERLPV